MKPNSLSTSNTNSVGSRVGTNGNMRLQVTGNVISHGFYIWSDSCVKENQEILENCLPKLMALEPKKYSYKNNINFGGEKPVSDTNEIKNATISAEKSFDISLNEPKHYGLIAQNVKMQFPNIVSNIGSIEAVNYTELVPILIKGLQEQQTIIESLKQEITDLKGKTVYTDEEKTKLYQNEPNPFNSITSFTYYIDEKQSFSNASIEIRDIMGSIKSELILQDNSGIGKVEYDGSILNPGYYIFSLKIDGRTKDSKMFLIDKK